MDSKPGSDPRILLRLSEQFLRRRHFDDCRKYTHHLNPDLPGVNEILAVAAVLLAGSIPDWYQVMQVNRYSNDSGLIKRKYDQLYGLLNPSVNKFAFANEALDVVRDAWRVLSDPLKKTEFDEFPRVYVGLCLKCPNDECGKAFTGLEIEPPPAQVLEVGKYVCSGFVMLGVRDGCWNPFVPVNKPKPKVSEKFVEISDDEEESGVNDGVKVEVEKAVVGRKKSFAKSTKKVTGVGNRVRKEAFTRSEEEEDDCEYF
ncbi:uncharacterized protein At4g38065-like [Bidens hawaiensis]|uniref:uncharacterized protein At4g38065-like n=1 Tax=Bidens hawaiensis TaxID=980011 RepID=UPI00404A9C42